MTAVAEEIIRLRNRELSRQQAYWHALWQDASDYIYPREDSITAFRQPGEDKTLRRYDDTALFDSQEMASGLFGTLFPMGQKDFNFTAREPRLIEIDVVRRWMAVATEICHQELFESNFAMQLVECLRAGAGVFGTGCFYSEWNPEHGGLNFRDFPLPRYQIRENSRGLVDTILVTIPLTARQAVAEYGRENLSDDLLKDSDSADREDREHSFIHVVRPRRERNPRLRDAANMAWESLEVEEKSKTIVRQGGYEENPFHVYRWMKSSSEVYGRGQGTEALATIRSLQVMSRDLLDLANRYANPPLEVRSDFEGRVDLRPGAQNMVVETGSIRGLDQTILGNFPVTEKTLEGQRALVHQYFYRDVFAQMTDLKGDRRTAYEISARLREGLQRLGAPVARLQSELLTPAITRALLLLIRHGRVPPPPPELSGASFGVEYLGPLSLALKAEESNGFVRWVSTLAQFAPVFPAVMDVVNADVGAKRLAMAYGVNIGDLASDEDIAAKRDQRQKQMDSQALAAEAQAAGQANKGLSKAPEPGSPAEALMGAMKE